MSARVDRDGKNNGQFYTHRCLYNSWDAFPDVKAIACGCP